MTCIRIGARSFREELLEQIGAKKGAQHYGEELRESDEQKAQRMVAGMLREAGWKESELGRRLKGDVKKGRMAARLRAETTMTVDWIAERLDMGSRGYLNHLLYRRRKSSHV
jgi:hypothetical protein